MAKPKSKFVKLTLILTDGQTRSGELERFPDLEILQFFVGGHLSELTLSKPLLGNPPITVMYVNEDGLSLKLSPNPTASLLAGRPIVGDVVIVEHLA
jgi:hypothetical protein